MVLDKIQPNFIHRLLPKGNYDQECMGNLDSGVTLLFDLSDLSHGLLEDGTFVRLDVEAVDVGEVG